ncbi:MAG: DUF1841 family protein [Candidatus Competibacteraceae bacterium]|nr:DUF1841 family protein [Candidatus Competibacteraceae bacterium]
MLYGQDRHQIRQVYLDAWQKYCTKQPLEPLQQQIAQVIAEHPEYHRLLQTRTLHKDFDPAQGESNPFLHMGLHLAVREQISTDRPPGIRALYQQLLQHYKDPHSTEHQVIEALAETLWQAQQNGAPPDEQRYLARLQEHLQNL